MENLTDTVLVHFNSVNKSSELIQGFDPVRCSLLQDLIVVDIKDIYRPLC